MMTANDYDANRLSASSGNAAGLAAHSSHHLLDASTYKANGAASASTFKKSGALASKSRYNTFAAVPVAAPVRVDARRSGNNVRNGTSANVLMRKKKNNNKQEKKRKGEKCGEHSSSSTTCEGRLRKRLIRKLGLLYTASPLCSGHKNRSGGGGGGRAHTSDGNFKDQSTHLDDYAGATRIKDNSTDVFFIAEGADIFCPVACGYQVGTPIWEAQYLKPLEGYWTLLQGTDSEDEDDEPFGVDEASSCDEGEETSFAASSATVSTPSALSAALRSESLRDDFVPDSGDGSLSASEVRYGLFGVINAPNDEYDAALNATQHTRSGHGDDAPFMQHPHKGRNPSARSTGKKDSSQAFKDPYVCLLQQRYWIEARIAILGHITARLRVLYEREQCSRMRSSVATPATTTSGFCNTGNLSVWRQDSCTTFSGGGGGGTSSGTSASAFAAGGGNSGSCEERGETPYGSTSASLLSTDDMDTSPQTRIACATVRFWQNKVILCCKFEELFADTTRMLHDIDVFSPFSRREASACVAASLCKGSQQYTTARTAFLSSTIAVEAQRKHVDELTARMRVCLVSHESLRQELRQFEMLERRQPELVMELAGTDMKAFLLSIAARLQKPSADEENTHNAGTSPLNSKPREEEAREKEAATPAGVLPAPQNNSSAIVDGSPPEGRLRYVISAPHLCFESDPSSHDNYNDNNAACAGALKVQDSQPNIRRRVTFMLGDLASEKDIRLEDYPGCPVRSILYTVVPCSDSDIMAADHLHSHEQHQQQHYRRQSSDTDDYTILPSGSDGVASGSKSKESGPLIECLDGGMERMLDAAAALGTAEQYVQLRLAMSLANRSVFEPIACEPVSPSICSATADIKDGERKSSKMKKQKDKKGSFRKEKLGCNQACTLM